MPKQVETKALEKLVVEYFDVSDIQPNEYNPNKQSEHDFDLLKRSMTDDGFTQPVIVQKSSMRIVDGEHRWKAARELGINPIPVVLVEMSDEQMKVATLRHNRARGEHDIELEAAVLRDLQALGAGDWAQAGLGMDDLEWERMLEDIPAPEALAGLDFGEGWTPGESNDDGAAGTRPADTREQSSTPSAAIATRTREDALAAAKTDEERAAVRKDNQVYRLMISFSPAEGEVIKRVLESGMPDVTAAARLLEIVTEIDDAG